MRERSAAHSHYPTPALPTTPWSQCTLVSLGENNNLRPPLVSWGPDFFAGEEGAPQPRVFPPPPPRVVFSCQACPFRCREQHTTQKNSLHQCLGRLVLARSRGSPVFRLAPRVAATPAACSAPYRLRRTAAAPSSRSNSSANDTPLCRLSRRAE